MSRSLIFCFAALIAVPAALTAAPPGANDVFDPFDSLSFDVRVLPGDPFDPAYEKLKAGDAVVKVRRGQTVRVEITGTPKAGFHTYPLTIRTSSQDEVSRLTLNVGKGVVPLWPVGETEPSRVLLKEEKPRTILEHDKPFVWTHEFLVLDDAVPGQTEIPIRVATSVCNEHRCVPFKGEIKVSFEVTGEEPIQLTPELVKRKSDPIPDMTVIKIDGGPPPNSEVKGIPVFISAPAAPTAGGTEPAPAAPTQATSPPKAGKESKHFVGLIDVSQQEYKARMEAIAAQIVKSDQAAQGSAKDGDAGLLAFLLAGMFWGGVSLITPCVFPMIPITVSYFLKQSEKQHNRPIVMASVYSLTIVVVLTLAAAFLLSAFRWLSVHPLMNYFLGGLFIFFALSLFGMYEIELPSGLARFTSSREGKGGLVGTIFMALTFTIISFACVAPFLGGFGGTAAAARPLWHNLLGGLAFSATFAAPFFILALFPTMLKAMPKSGSWLNSVKVVMGFLELAAAFKFLRGAELLQTGGDITFFSYDLVLGIWVALAFLCGLYLIGAYNLPHDTPSENIGVGRLLFAATFFGLAIYLAPALLKVNAEGESQRPVGAVYAWVDAFLLPESRGGSSADGVQRTGDLHYALAQSREHLKRTGQAKPIFVDFTGLVCANCRLNERNVFPKPEVQDLLKKYINVEIYTDGMPLHLYGPEVRAEVERNRSRGDADAEANAMLQQKVFDEITLPTYAIFQPQADGKIVLVDSYTEGRISDVGVFVEFLSGRRAAK